MIGRCSLRSGHLFYSPCTFHVEQLHTVHTNILRTEWKYKRKYAATPTLRCSYNFIYTALGEFFHLQCEFQLEDYFLIITNETYIYAQKIKIKKIKQCSFIYGK